MPGHNGRREGRRGMIERCAVHASKARARFVLELELDRIDSNRLLLLMLCCCPLLYCTPCTLHCERHPAHASATNARVSVSQQPPAEPHQERGRNGEVAWNAGRSPTAALCGRRIFAF